MHLLHPWRCTVLVLSVTAVLSAELSSQQGLIVLRHLCFGFCNSLAGRLHGVVLVYMQAGRRKSSGLH